MVGRGLREAHSVYKALSQKTVGRDSLTFDKLLTSLTEIEAILNSRPISYISAGDTEEPLTTSHLLIGRRILTLPDNLDYICDLDDEEYEVDTSTLTRRMKNLNNVKNHFWIRWKREYLAELRESHRNLLRMAGGNSQISVGDIVIVHDEDLARRFWKLGRVVKLIIGVDKQVRGATVIIANGKGRTTKLNRPLKLLYPLEVSLQDKSVNSSTEHTTSFKDSPRSNHPDSSVDSCSRHFNDSSSQNLDDFLPSFPDNHDPQAQIQRPRRAAATRSEERWRELDSDSSDWSVFA